VVNIGVIAVPTKKPDLRLISDNGAADVTSSVAARSIRRRRTYSPIVHP